jgi:alpha-amylase/alpha-mannosidase (GH57 family)
MIYWAPLFHFYQPPTQTRDILKKVSNESYRPLLDVIESYPHAKATININGVLTEMLAESGYTDVISKLRELAMGGQVEFTGSGMYHPILPLIPASEMERQIGRNQRVNRELLGDVYTPRGFFPPEMCFSRQIVEPVLEARHEWVIMSGVACPVTWPVNVVHRVGTDKESLAVLFRDDILSNKISFRNIEGKDFVEHLRGLGSNGGNVYVVTAMDAETFGHHIQHWEKLFLAEVYENLQNAPAPAGAIAPKPVGEQHRKLFELQRASGENAVDIVTISEIVDLFPAGDLIEPRPSSWSTTDDDVRQRNYYPLWDSPGNRLHEMLWEHVHIVTEMVNKATEVADNPESRRYTSAARTALDPALHSDQWWWASRRPMWDINMVHRGLGLQRVAMLNAFKAIRVSGCGTEIKKDYQYKVLAARWVAGNIIDLLTSEKDE